ncbi:MAG: ribonuclease D [Gammaproteobacteria bacterium]|nr:ribonuclease D [Gammaproteobacteria bacterium]MCW8924438.1 ribonuclease D [Gammaproteobacteria bacterium]
MKPILIEDNQTLTQFCNKLINEPLLAIDTEFFRETTYYPHLGLIQIASPSDIICIDPLAFDARDELRRLFFNTDITKVLHSCSQDMEVLYQYFGELPAPIFDTQIAAAMLGYQDQIGYAKLVAEEYDVELDKSQTRTNWLKRPLSAKQIEYAGEDVLYLLPLYEKFSSALTEKNRELWLQEDCEQLCGNEQRFQPDMENCWQRVKGYIQLEGVQLAVCRSVAQWREQLAMQQDLTRRKIMTDDLVLKIAATVNNKEQLKTIDNHIARFSADAQHALAEAIETGLQTPESKWPVINRQRPSPEEKRQLRHLQGLVQNKAETLNIHQSVLCSKKDLEKLLQGSRSGKLLNGWRFDCIGKQLLAEVDQS